jgi:hypothetical protein
MLDVSSLLRIGWENIWKNKILWVFSFLVLLEPISRFFIPIQNNNDLALSFLNLAIGFTSLYLSYISEAGVSFVSYCIAIGEPVNMQTAYQASKKIFWRVVALSFFLFLIISPCICTAFVLSFKQTLQIADFAHNTFFTSIPLSVFAAVQYFAITETIASNSKIGKSLKAAWTVFTYHFASLAIIGLLLAIASYTVNVSIGATIMLAQNGFDFTSLSTLDFISPHLSFTDNNFYKLVSAIFTAIWGTYSTSVFTVAYLKYNGVNK